MNWGLDNKRVLITGGSRGIGRGIAREFARAQSHVCFTYQSQHEKAQEVINDLKTLGSGNHKHISFNIADEAAVEENLSKIIETWGLPNHLIHNAGITRDQLILRMKPSDWDEVMNTNLRGAFLLTKFMVKAWIKAKQPGSIIHISSVIGQTGNPGQSNYAASKAGLIAFTKSIAQEVASRKIRVNCVAPGFIRSDMTEKLSEDQKVLILEKIPWGEVGEPEDVAHACLFLASEFARYMTGQTLNVNGGLHMS